MQNEQFPGESTVRVIRWRKHDLEQAERVHTLMCELGLATGTAEITAVYGIARIKRELAGLTSGYQDEYDIESVTDDAAAQ